jgi:hypothetical protein
MFGNLAPTDIINIVNAVLYVLVFISFFFLPRLLTWQIVSSLEFKVKTYNDMVIKSQRLILKKIGTKTKLTKKELDDSVKGMMDYFVIEPDAVEPSGLANKIRQLTQRHDKKLDMFIDDITSGMTPEEKKNLAAGMMHTIGIYQISKIIRHFIELIKETKNYQLGMILQMQLPFIDKQVKALYASVPAFTNSIPVGDCIGPLYAATLIGDAKLSRISEGTVVAIKEINGKEVYILKAEGPGANLGNIDEAIRKIVSKNKIEKIITVDASGKLEGEKTGEVAMGVGFAMGPRGAERYFAESFLMEKGIPVDAIAVKMKPEEALMPMPLEIKNALPKIDKAVRAELKEVKKKAIVCGIGVTVGVGNNRKAAEDAQRVIEDYHKREELRKKEEEKKKSGFWKRFGI